MKTNITNSVPRAATGFLLLIAAAGCFRSTSGEQQSAAVVTAESKSLTKADSANLRSFVEQAAALHRTERYPEALVLLDRAANLSPTSIGARFNRALTLSELGEFNRALLDLDTAVVLRPGLAPARTERGALLSLLGRSDAANADWARALQLDSTYIWSRFYRGIDAIAHGRYTAAAADLDAVASRESLVSAHLWRWTAHALNGRVPPALPASDTTWPGPIAAHLRGELSADSLVSTARRQRMPLDDRRLASAWFFIAQRLLAAGDRGAAERALGQVLQARAPRHAEALVAELQLRRIRAGRT